MEDSLVWIDEDTGKILENRSWQPIYWHLPAKHAVTNKNMRSRTTIWGITVGERRKETLFLCSGSMADFVVQNLDLDTAL